MQKTFLRKKIKNKRTLKKRMKGGMFGNNRQAEGSQDYIQKYNELIDQIVDNKHKIKRMNNFGSLSKPLSEELEKYELIKYSSHAPGGGGGVGAGVPYGDYGGGGGGGGLLPGGYGGGGGLLPGGGGGLLPGGGGGYGGGGGGGGYGDYGGGGDGEHVRMTNFGAKKTIFGDPGSIGTFGTVTMTNGGATHTRFLEGGVPEGALQGVGGGYGGENFKPTLIIGEEGPPYKIFFKPTQDEEIDTNLYISNQLNIGKLIGYNNQTEEFVTGSNLSVITYLNDLEQRVNSNLYINGVSIEYEHNGEKIKTGYSIDNEGIVYKRSQEL